MLVNKPSRYTFAARWRCGMAVTEIGDRWRSYTGMFPVVDTSCRLIAVCVSVCVSVCLSADISLNCAKND